MSHYFDFEDLRNSIYQIIEVALSAEAVVSRYAIGIKDYEKIFRKEEYWKRTKSVISNNSIEVAVKTRNLAELLGSVGVKYEFKKSISIYDSHPTNGLGMREVDLRFICNKIIHAKSFSVDKVASFEKHPDLIWWSGDLTISGTYENKSWGFFFNVLEWCDELVLFIDNASRELIKLNGNKYLSS